MKIRAVIFDIYQTLLEVGPPPPDANRQWNAIWQEYFSVPARASLQGILTGCEAVIACEHAEVRRAGIPFPEVLWTKVAAEVIPELEGLAGGVRDEFLFREARLLRSLTPHQP